MSETQTKANEAKANGTNRNATKQAPKSKLYFPPFEIHAALKAYVKEAYGLEIDVEDFAKNNGMIELSGDMVKK